MEYKHEFEIGIDKKIAAHNYGNINLKMINLTGNSNTLTVTNMSQTAELSHNLLSIIFLARKDVKIYLKKASQLLEIVIDKKIFDLANIIENQYIIRLIEIPKLAIVNQVIALIIKTQHT